MQLWPPEKGQTRKFCGRRGAGGRGGVVVSSGGGEGGWWGCLGGGGGLFSGGGPPSALYLKERPGPVFVRSCRRLMRC